MQQKSHPLTREELANAAEIVFRRTFPGLAKHGSTAITERTIRFWTQEKLLPGRGRPNQTALYEPEILDRCVFIRRLQVEKALTLVDIRKVLASVDQATIKRVAEGTEPLRIAFALDGVSDLRSDSNEQVVVLREEIEKMIAVNNHRPHRRDDRPERLQQISDFDKGAAVADALQRTTKQEFSVDVHAVDYSGRFFEKGSFRSPAKIDCGVSVNAGKVDDKATVGLIRKVTDADLCSAIASELSARSGEKYVVELLRKKYDFASTGKASLDLAFLVATPDERA